MYHQESTWKIPQTRFSLGKNRKSFCDQEVQRAKQTPSVHTYKPQVDQKILLSHAIDKSEGNTYIADF